MHTFIKFLKVQLHLSKTCNSIMQSIKSVASKNFVTSNLPWQVCVDQTNFKQLLKRNEYHHIMLCMAAYSMKIKFNMN